MLLAFVLIFFRLPLYISGSKRAVKKFHNIEKLKDEACSLFSLKIPGQLQNVISTSAQYSQARCTPVVSFTEMLAHKTTTLAVIVVGSLVLSHSYYQSDLRLDDRAVSAVSSVLAGGKLWGAIHSFRESNDLIWLGSSTLKSKLLVFWWRVEFFLFLSILSTFPTLLTADWPELLATCLMSCLIYQIFMPEFVEMYNVGRDIKIRQLASK